MGLFDKKYCDVCGDKIGLLGNRKLEDGNLCKECASKLSPWFSERHSSTVEDIRAQLEYREANRQAVSAFHTTRSLGRSTKVLLDEDRQKFMVTSARDLAEANPDVLSYSQVTGCDLEIDEDRHELKRADKEGKQVSYVPPRYEYSYNFFVTIRVNHPYFDDMRFRLNSGAVNTGERAMAGSAAAGWSVSTNRLSAGTRGVNEYYEYVEMGNEIKAALTEARQEIRSEIAAANAPKTAVTCPFCGASTIPDANGCCEYCGGAVNG